MEGESSMKTKRILIVEDNGIAAMEIESILKSMSSTAVFIASNYARALDLYKSKQPNMLLLDIDLQEEKDGIDIAKQIRKTDDLPIIYLTADHDENTIQRAALTMPSSYLNKPFSKEQLQAAVTLAWSIYQNLAPVQCELTALSAYHSFDHHTENLYEGNSAVHLSPNEKHLIKIFCQSKKQLLDTASLNNLIWMGDTPLSESALRTLIYRLNKKLKHKLFEYIPPTGYRIVPYPTSTDETAASSL